MPNKPTPVELRILRGNPGRRPIPDNVPRVSDKPRCPQWLKGEARKEWRRIISEIGDVIDRRDRMALALYCQAFAEYMEYSVKVRDEGAIFTADSGYTQRNANVSMRNDAEARMRWYLSEFGCTPSSRTRVRVKQAADEPSMADKLRDAIGD